MTLCEMKRNELRLLTIISVEAELPTSHFQVWLLPGTLGLTSIICFIHSHLPGWKDTGLALTQQDLFIRKKE